MGTASFQWGAHDGTPGDGSSGNAGPALVTRVGTETNPKKLIEVAQFDAATDEHLWFSGVMPASYVSGGQVDIYWLANAVTATVVRWGSRIAAVTPGDADTPVEHSAAAATTDQSSTNTTEALRLTKLSLTLAALDGLAAGDLFWLLVYRDADATSGTDSLAVDAELVRVEFSFTV